MSHDFGPLFLATLSNSPGFTESVLYLFTGLMVVFIALGLIWALMEILGAFFRRLAAAQAAGKSFTGPPHPVPHPDATGKIPAATLAVIAAAIHCTIGQRRHRIVSIEAAEPHDWSREGRRDIFSSHRVR